jgi:hypothetical protein
MNIPGLRFRLGVARKGSSLAEMIIAILILSFVVISIMMAMIVSTNNTVAYKDEENARQLALEVLEDCERVPFDGIAGVDYRTSIQNLSKSRNSEAGNPIRAEASAVVSGTLDTHSTLPISADVTVNVTWNSAIGGRKTISMRREVSVSAWQNVGDRSF